MAETMASSQNQSHKCPRAELLAEFALGKLTDRQVHISVSAHLETCNLCIESIESVFESAFVELDPVIVMLRNLARRGLMQEDLEDDTIC